jgi:hypothetical protein
MDELVRFETSESSVLVEVEAQTYGIERVGRGADGIQDAVVSMGHALEGIADAARSATEALRELAPDKLELEFGVKLTAEAGAIIAKTSGEAHFTVSMSWESARDSQSR